MVSPAQKLGTETQNNVLTDHTPEAGFMLGLGLAWPGLFVSFLCWELEMKHHPPPAHKQQL
jgi:hypothetical protein